MDPMRPSIVALSLVSALMIGAACGSSTPTPAGPGSDAGEVVPDSGFPDSGIQPDAGTPDAGMPPDGGVPPDGGIPPDGGTVPDGGAPDSGTPGFDFSCVGAASPTSAPNPLSLGGTLTDLTSGNGQAGITAEAHLVAGDALLGTTTTNTAGAYSLSIANPSASPVDAYLQFTPPGAGPLRTFLYPPEPFSANATALDSSTTNTTTLSLLYGLAGMSLNAADGTSLVLVTDCAGAPIPGATVGFSPAAGRVVYLSNGLPSTGATETDLTGLALGLNVPPGNSTITASFQGTSLKSHVILIRGGSITQTSIHP
jgi:hypothetical protein